MLSPCRLPFLHCFSAFLPFPPNRWRQEFGGRRVGAQQAQKAVPRPDIRCRDLPDARPQPGHRLRHPLGEDSHIQRGQFVRRDIHGILPPLKAAGLHELLDVLVGPLEKLRVPARFLAGIVLSQRVLAQIEGDLLPAHSHYTAPRAFPAWASTSSSPSSSCQTQAAAQATNQSERSSHDCTAHFIRTDLLTEGVTENLRKVTSYAAKHEARFMKLLTEQTEDGSKRRNAARKKELEAAEKRIAELSAIFKRLYEDSVTGRISDERFTELSADYEAEQKELKEKAAALQSELSKTLEATANAEKFMKVVRKYTSFEELTPTLLREFVEKIVIHESEALDGKRRGKLRRQEIEIYYSFVGKVELPD